MKKILQRSEVFATIIVNRANEGGTSTLTAPWVWVFFVFKRNLFKGNLYLIEI